MRACPANFEFELFLFIYIHCLHLSKCVYLHLSMFFSCQNLAIFCTFYLHVCRLIFVRSGLCVSIFFVSVERFPFIPRMPVSREYYTFVRTRTRTR